MVGAINAPSESSVKDFIDAAGKWKAASTVPPVKNQGGTFQAAGSLATSGGSTGGGASNTTGGATGGASGGDGGNAAGHIVASTSMVSAFAGLLAWSLL
jgi:hypothetical protein